MIRYSSSAIHHAYLHSSAFISSSQSLLPYNPLWCQWALIFNIEKKSIDPAEKYISKIGKFWGRKKTVDNSWMGGNLFFFLQILLFCEQKAFSIFFCLLSWCRYRWDNNASDELLIALDFPPSSSLSCPKQFSDINSQTCLSRQRPNASSMPGRDNRKSFCNLNFKSHRKNALQCWLHIPEMAFFGGSFLKTKIRKKGARLY